jgi:putative sigma-54 modulation protein
MNVTYTTRGFVLTDQIRKYSEDKLRKIQSLDDLIDVTLNLEHARHMFKAELLVHNRSARFNAIQTTPDVFKSINAVIDKIQKQVKRHKEKLIGRKRKAPARTTDLIGTMAGTETVVIPRIIRARKQDVKPMSQEEAVMQLESGSFKASFLIYRDTETDRITVLFRRKDGNYGLVDSEI